MEDDSLHVYTDGSLRHHKRGGWAYVICGYDHRLWGEGQDRTGSSYRTEILGVVRALESLHGAHRLVVHTDCRAMADKVNELAAAPKHRRVQAVPNRWKEAELWRELAALMTTHDLTAVWEPRLSTHFAERVHHQSRAAADRGRA